MRHLIFFPLAVLLFASCEHKVVQPEIKQFAISDTMMNMIKLDTVTTCNVAGELSLSGVVSFNENNVVKVFPRSSGQVVEARVSPGDRVVKGQTLAVVKSADVAGNYNDLESANADLAIAKRQMTNAEQLFSSGISSEREYNEAKENYQKALASRNKIQSLININGGGRTSAGGRYLITAPIDGYIVEKKVTAGAFIRPDMGDNLFTISNLRDVWIFANVYEADINKIKEGDIARVVPMAYPDRVFNGKIAKISQVLDPQSKAMKVRISLDNKEMLLKPEMYAKIMVKNEAGQRSVCVPSTAIISQDGKNYVVIYKSRTDVKVAEVEVVKNVEGKTFIQSGVDAGQLVIVEHQLFIFNQLTNE
jgi:cobalt-zinc-cadmium efflux system membrane fusion protein